MLRAPLKHADVGWILKTAASPFIIFVHQLNFQLSKFSAIWFNLSINHECEILMLLYVLSERFGFIQC